jgi:DNA-binding FrmR family transcriptional regulator
MIKPDAKKNIDTRLKRVSGQVAGIQRMVDDERYCVDILMQIAAVRSALGKVGQLLLASHVDTCVAGALKGDDAKQRQAKIDELLHVFEKYGLR